MKFWGVEVKSGQRLKVKPEFGKLVHMSQAAAGEVKDAKGAKNVPIKVKIDGNEFVMGFLSADRPQVMFDLVFEREFELSHDWKQGGVYFIGYRAGDSDCSSGEEGFENGLVEAVGKGRGNVEHTSENVKPAAAAAADAAAAKGEDSDSSAKGVVKHLSENVKPAAAKGDDSDSSDEDSDGSGSSSDDGMPIIGEEDYSDLSGDDDFDELSESIDEEELPKVQQYMERPAETICKQAALVKSGNKKGHNATGKKSNEQPLSAGNDNKGQFKIREREVEGIRSW